MEKIDKIIYKRLFTALRGSRKSWAFQFNYNIPTIYPLPVLVDICRKIAVRTDCDFFKLIELNQWLNQNEHYDKSF